MPGHNSTYSHATISGQKNVIGSNNQLLRTEPHPKCDWLLRYKAATRNCKILNHRYREFSVIFKIAVVAQTLASQHHLYLSYKLITARCYFFSNHALY